MISYLDGWTYGAEHELADWDCSRELPANYQRADDWTLVNSNGIAVQPSPKDYPYGGEINTPPTATPEEQAACLEEIKASLGVVSINYRSNLHIHVRVPNLSKSLKHLKLLQKRIHEELPTLLDKLEPIPVGQTPAEKKRAKRRKVSHRTFLSKKRLENQLKQTSLTAFFEAEVPKTKADRKPMWHAQPRVCVNIRQLLQTDTVEFRHFPGTLSENELLSAVQWCRDFMLAALREEPLPSSVVNGSFPVFPKFDRELEVCYQATAAHNGLSREEIQNNIRLIKEGRFNGTSERKRAEKLADGVSRKHL